MASNLLQVDNQIKRLEVWVENGGLNTKQPSFQIADNESPDCKNVLYQDGCFRRRFGYSKLQSTNQPLEVNQATVWNVPFGTAGVTQYLATCGTNVYKGSADAAWTDTGNTVGDAEEAVDNAYGCRVGGYFIFSGGKSAGGVNSHLPYKWDLASTVTALDVDSQFTGATDMVVFENFLLALGTNTNGTLDNYGRRVWYSDVNQIEVWGTGLSDYVDIDHTAGAIVRGLVDGRTLYLFKKDSVSTAVITGDSARVFDWRVLTDIRGCPNRSACVMTPAGPFFVSGDGVYNARRIYENLAINVWASMRSGLVNLNQVAMVSCMEDSEIWLGQFAAGTPTFYVYNYVTGTWSKQLLSHTMWSIQSSATYEQAINADTVNEFLVFGGNVGNVWKYNKAYATDDGTAIDSYQCTKDFPLTSPTVKDRVKRIKFLAKASLASQHVHVSYSVDFGASYSELTDGGSPVSITTNWVMYEVDANIDFAYTFRLKFHDASLEYQIPYFAIDYISGQTR